MYEHPLPFIEELKSVPIINKFEDLLKVLGAVYTIVPWTETPYLGEIDLIDVKFESDTDLRGIYKKFKKIQIGGWCGLNNKFFRKILTSYSIKNESYNYGLSIGYITHIGAIVEFEGNKLFFDPYFARYFVNTEGLPISFEDLMFLIREKKFDEYKSVFLCLKKPVKRENGTVDYLFPQELLEGSIEIFKQNGLEKVLREVFGTSNPDSLMLIKISD